MATDPGSANDFPLLCQQTGNELIDTPQEGGVFHFYIRKS
jgi:tRNA 2-thiouridine synthesizing protein A